MRGWTIQIERRALTLTLAQLAACVFVVAVMGLVVPRATFEDFFWVVALTVAVYALIAVAHLAAASIKIAGVKGVASSSADPPRRSDCQQRQLGRSH